MAIPALRSFAARDLRDPAFDRLVESFFGPGLVRPLSAAEVTRAWRPLAQVRTTDEAYVLTVEVPGLGRDELEIDVLEDRLTVRGEYAADGAERRLRSGRFEYRTVLPRDVDAAAISAVLADGVLTVTVPRAEAAQPRRIEISAS